MTYLNQEWLRGYRLGGGGKDGGAADYLLSRQQLQKWCYVDKMTPTELQEKYRVECGVYADRAHLVKWVQVFTQARMLCRYVQNVFKMFLSYSVSAINLYTYHVHFLFVYS